jgi:hypothetical protein
MPEKLTPLFVTQFSYSELMPQTSDVKRALRLRT